MHWARSHVDPMLALRNIVCNDRWEEAWPCASAEERTATIRSLQEVFRQALEQTAAVLRSVSGGAPTSSFGDTRPEESSGKPLKVKGLS